MRKLSATLAALSVVCATLAPLPGRASSVENPLFGYPHRLPSPFTLPAGTLVYGTWVGYGITDFLEIGTDLLANFSEVYNAQAKLSLADHPVFALGLSAGWERYDLRNISASYPSYTITSFLPGAVASFAVLPTVALFVGGNLNYTQQDIPDQGDTSGYVRGASVGADLSWAYNPRKKGRSSGIGNVLSGGVSYDTSYKLFGFGFSHHWPGFHLGIHYYPGADLYPVRPIIAGGGSVSF